MSAIRLRAGARRGKGSSLILVLMFATTIASFCLFSLASSQAVYKTAKAGLETTRAFYLAEGGIDYALSQLSQDRYWAATSSTDLPVAAADGSFEHAANSTTMTDRNASRPARRGSGITTAS